MIFTIDDQPQLIKCALELCKRARKERLKLSTYNPEVRILAYQTLTDFALFSGFYGIREVIEKAMLLFEKALELRQKGGEKNA